MGFLKWFSGNCEDGWGLGAESWKLEGRRKYSFSSHEPDIRKL
jgi:hypothetical protein